MTTFVRIEEIPSVIKCSGKDRMFRIGFRIKPIRVNDKPPIKIVKNPPFITTPRRITLNKKRENELTAVVRIRDLIIVGKLYQKTIGADSLQSTVYSNV